ncbi:MAG: cytochrome c-type biogenesis protein CcmH [Burkholderiales bacterium]|nr:cytochrome c-type biogenesis protein CcmH [Burkholderiales bacterium]
MPRHSIFGLARAIVVAILAAAAWPAFAQADPALDARLKRLEEELRCLVCQNQSLADSNAPLAEDLRREVHGLAASGKSDDEIKAFLVARYGDFVLYRPPMKGTTWLLWFGPLVLLVAGGAVWWRVGRRRGSMDQTADGNGVADRAPDAGADVDLAKARALLDAPQE